MHPNLFSKRSRVLSLLSILFVMFLASCAQTDATPNKVYPTFTSSHTPEPGASSSPTASPYPHPTPVSSPTFPAYLKGKTASLSWIYGHDCQEGIDAYLQTAQTNPTAALVGTAWVNPLYGNLITGNNNCVVGSSSMDNVVQLVHREGGLAYLTVTMATEGANAWSYQQGAAYVAMATRKTSYIRSIVNEVERAGDDGVIMDLAGVDYNYPDIQHLFALFNQRMWDALPPLHKWYGIALIHQLSDHDEYYKINGFENWSLLAHTADFIVIMAVDQSLPVPGPAVSLPWLEQILAYTMQTMPSMLAHIIWELPLYGDKWHWDGNKWVFDGIISYQVAREMVQYGMTVRVDSSASDLHDFYAPHLVYTGTSGIKRAVWYPTASGLYSIIFAFRQIVQQEPTAGTNRLQIAVWWRTTQEPSDFWPLLDKLY